MEVFSWLDTGFDIGVLKMSVQALRRMSYAPHLCFALLNWRFY